MKCVYDGLIKENFMPYFHKHGESSIPFLVEGKISSMVFLWAYRKLAPIEKMPKNEKDDLKKYVRNLFPNFTPKQKLNACKIIYTIGTLA